MEEPSVKTKRGRPKGSGRHQKGDAITLEKMADQRLQYADRPLAVIVRSLVDVKRDTGGIRRLQRAYGAQEQRLIAAASERFQRHEIEAFDKRARAFLIGMVQTVDIFADRLAAWERSPEGRQVVALFSRFQAAADSPEVRKWAALAATVDRRLRHGPYIAK